MTPTGAAPARRPGPCHSDRMTLHRQTSELLAAMAALGLPTIEEQTPADARAQRAAMLRLSPEPIADVRDVDASGVGARFYRPAVTRSNGLLVWFHGGGWVLGNLETHDDLCRALANRGGFCVLSADYRLAPEHPFPAAVDDARTVTEWARDHAVELGCDQLIALGGDSAGGNLAAVVANRPTVPVCFQALVYPCTDARMGSQSFVDIGQEYNLSKSAMAWFYDHYLSGPDGSAEDPLVSPLLEDDARLASVPSAIVVTAEYDPLRDEGDAYAARLAAAGVATSHVRFAGQIHGFLSMFGLLDDCRSAQAMVAEAVSSAFLKQA
jgi:acetyl esterase/lipase